ncbi:hypothetical protein BKA93DRAFT_288675 [Sparassis latifolia]
MLPYDQRSRERRWGWECCAHWHPTLAAGYCRTCILLENPPSIRSNRAITMHWRTLESIFLSWRSIFFVSLLAPKWIWWRVLVSSLALALTLSWRRPLVLLLALALAWRWLSFHSELGRIRWPYTGKGELRFRQPRLRLRLRRSSTILPGALRSFSRTASPCIGCILANVTAPLAIPAALTTHRVMATSVFLGIFRGLSSGALDASGASGEGVFSRSLFFLREPVCLSLEVSSRVFSRLVLASVPWSSSSYVVDHRGKGLVSE